MSSFLARIGSWPEALREAVFKKRESVGGSCMEITKDALLTSEVVDEVAVIGFNRGRIRDEREILKTLESLGRYMESRSNLKVVLNLANVEYLSSAGLGHLVGLLKKARARGSVFKLCAMREAIMELFEVMRLTKIFEIFPGVKEAVESFKKPEASVRGGSAGGA